MSLSVCLQAVLLAYSHLLAVSVSVCVYVSLYVCLYVSLSVYRPCCWRTRTCWLSVSVCVYVSLYVCLYVSLCVCLQAVLLENSHLLAVSAQRNGICEVLYAAAWICGEFSE